MPRKESEAVPEAIGPIPQNAGKIITWEKLRRLVEKNVGRSLKEIKEDSRSIEQRVARLEHDARRPRLAMEADGPENTKTRERMEGAARAVQAKYGDSCTAQRVQDRPKISTCFGVMAESLALPCRDDAGVKNSAASPKLCLPSLEMRSPTAAVGLLPTGEASTATKITFNQPPLRLYLTEETNSKKTSTQHVSYDSSFWRDYLSAAPFCRESHRDKIRRK